MEPFGRLVSGPRAAVGLWALVLIPCIVGLAHFRLDASSDSLVLERDPDLRYYDDTRAIFGADSSLVVLVQPRRPVFDPATLDSIEALAKELEADEQVASVMSVTRAPLFLSPPTGLLNLADGYKTIAADAVEPALARAEILGSPLYSEALISTDGKTTALQLSLVVEERLLDLEQERYRLRDLEQDGQLSAADRALLATIQTEFRRESMAAADRRQALILRLREALERYQEIGLVELGGLPMITADIVRYIGKDLVVFGIGSILFAMLALSLLFRSLAWTMAITLNSALTVLALLGVLGWMDWRVTVVTSNLASLLFILTMSMSVHIAIRYREEQSQFPQERPSRPLARALHHVFVPCLFTVLTTMVGFGSLYLSDLRPVMDFALMMGIGLTLAFATCFTFLPSLVLLFPLAADGSGGLVGTGGQARRTNSGAVEAEIESKASAFALAGRWSLAHRGGLGVAAVVTAGLSVLGIARLGVENSFVDYFKSSTPIYRGLHLIDEELGGTTPLEIVLDSAQQDGWLDMDRLESLGELHSWLAAQPEIGHVSSLHSLVLVLEQVIAADPNPALRNARVNNFLLWAIRQRIPENVAESALRPFVSTDYSVTRIISRVRESTPGLDREELLVRIRARLDQEPVARVDDQRVTGMFVLYNNMLQSLVRSQISTLSAVLLSIAAMFWLMLRSIRLSLIALVPNILPVCVVLGTLGWVGIPLDMMTIMIAAITLGISVDDTVHYLYRYRRELGTTNSQSKAVERSHDTVGRAMVATTVAVTFGFSVLVFSNFKPTIYFGVLTGLAMVTALLADVFLLPALLGSAFDRRPLKPER